MMLNYKESHIFLLKKKQMCFKLSFKQKNIADDESHTKNNNLFTISVLKTVI